MKKIALLLLAFFLMVTNRLIVSHFKNKLKRMLFSM